MIHIATSEWIIMKELWKSSPLTSRQIINNISPHSDWNDKTVHTLISRLCKKGAIRAVKNNNSHTYDYYAQISEDECIKDETRNFLDRVFQGSLKNMVSAFVKDNEISQSDVKELRELLDSLGKDEQK